MVELLMRVPHELEVWSSNTGLFICNTVLKTTRYWLNIYASSCDALTLYEGLVL